jgi:peptide/nickel transport system permease protein
MPRSTVMANHVWRMQEPLAVGPPRRTFARRIWTKHYAPAGIGALVVIMLILVSLAAPTIAPYGPLQTRVGLPLQPPSAQFLMGTDHLGRDVFSGFVFGARISSFVGVASILVATVIGVLVGLAAGYRGGGLDDVLMRLTEVFQVIPLFVAALIFTTLVGGSILNVVTVIALLSWPAIARVVRAETLSLRSREFVLAAKAIGVGDNRIMLRHLLPNALSAIIVIVTLQIGSAILTEAGLSFMGVGDPNHISWGQQLQDAQRFLRTAWWMAVFPGAAIFVTVLSLNLLGDFLSEAMNPLMRNL